MTTNSLPRMGVLTVITILGLLFTTTGNAFSEGGISEGATVYVPVYSHIYVGIKGHPFDLAISLSIRNTDKTDSVTVLRVDYYDSNGKLVRKYLDNPKYVEPLASMDFFVSETDTTGGFGASFLVKWKSTKRINEPIIESVMAGTRSGQGISFTSRGQTIRERLE